MKKLDLRGSNKDIFYKIIYPATAKEFLFKSLTIKKYLQTVDTMFIINEIQREYIFEHKKTTYFLNRWLIIVF